MEPDKEESKGEFKVPGLLGPPASRKTPNKPKQTDDAHQDSPAAIKVQPVATVTSEDGDNDGAGRRDGNKADSTTSPQLIKAEMKEALKVPSKRVELKLNYHEPPGAMLFDSRYCLEVLKTGSIVDRVKFPKDKSHLVVGRTPACDIVAENPTVSRMHAIIQFIGGTSKQEDPSENGSETEAQGSADCKERGLYLYDLKSTHGTFLNKNQVYPNRYYRLRVGHMIKFGNSTRQYIVDGPSEDQEEESDKTVTELLQERLQKEFARKKLMENPVAVEAEKVEETGINWGMGEDAVEETDYAVNPFSVDFESSDLSLDNPKKTLAGWFEREGYDSLFYDVREKASGHFICRVNLPLDGPNGAPVFAEVDVKGKKKEAVVQCALKACQILDTYGVLRQSHHEGYKKKLKDWEEKDYYSSDEDTFLDRTGSIETKRKRRMRQSGKDVEKAESFDSLNEKHSSLEDEILKLEEKIQKAVIKQEKEDEEVDPLEAFMQTVKSGALDIKQMRSKLKQLKEEQLHVKKLIEIARPANLPASLLKRNTTAHSAIKSEKIEPAERQKPLTVDDPACNPVIDDSSKPVQQVKVENIASDVEPTKPEEFGGTTTKPEEPDNRSLKRTAAKPLVSSSVHSTFLEENPDDDDTNETKHLDEDDDTTVSSKKKRKRHRAQFKREEKAQYDSENPDYSVTWVPPADQKGDGKTKLNEKLGY